MSPEQAPERRRQADRHLVIRRPVVGAADRPSALRGREVARRDARNVQTAAIDLDELPRETPPAVRDILARCLDRDPRTRLRDIGEARIHIQRARAAPLSAPVAGMIWRQRLARAWPWVALALAAAAVILLVIDRRSGRAAAEPAPVTFHIDAPPQVTVIGGPALSPDGRHLAFTAKAKDGRVGIWVHALQSGDAHPLAGTKRLLTIRSPSTDQPLRRVRDRPADQEDRDRRRSGRGAVRSLRPHGNRQPRLPRRRVEHRRRDRLCDLERRFVAPSGCRRHAATRHARRRLRLSGLPAGWCPRALHLVRTRSEAGRLRRRHPTDRTAASAASRRWRVRRERVRTARGRRGRLPSGVARRGPDGPLVRSDDGDAERRAAADCTGCARRDPTPRRSPRR